jgi:hypothetical protein
MAEFSVQSQLRSHTIKLHSDPSFVTLSDSTYYHTMHCIDVLRQLIVCASDSTLIFRREEDKFPGEGRLRTCQNFGALKFWTQEHRFYKDIVPWIVSLKKRIKLSRRTTRDFELNYLINYHYLGHYRKNCFNSWDTARGTSHIAYHGRQVYTASRWCH